MSNQNDTMVQEAPTRNRYTPKSPPEMDVPEVPTPYLAVATATAKSVVTHPVTTHTGIGALGFLSGLFVGRETMSRSGHLKRVFTGSPSSAKGWWKRLKNSF